VLATIPIDDPADPRVAGYMNLKDAWLAVGRGVPTPDQRAGLFIAEGELVVRQLLGSRHEVVSVLATPTRLGSLSDALNAIPTEVPVYEASRAVIERIVGFDLHRGVLALGRRPDPPDPDALLAHAPACVVLEDLANHDNVGGIFRSVAALAGRSVPVLLTARCCDPLYRKAVRVSMGQVLRVPWARLEDWPGDLARVRRAGFRVAALTPGTDAEPIESLGGRDDRVALLLGAEGKGLSEAALCAADVRVRIPIDARADSLNVVVAGSIALHHLAGTSRANRQQTKRGMVE